MRKEEQTDKLVEDTGVIRQVTEEGLNNQSRL